MQYTFWAFAFFGFIAFVRVSTLESRLRKLERSLEEPDSQPRADIRELMAEYIGKNVQLDFYEDEGDVDIETYYYVKGGTLTIVDVDEAWVLVHGEAKKKTQDKLLRLSSIRGITLREEK